MTGGTGGKDRTGRNALDRPIVFVNQHYAPDVASTGQYLTDLAEFLVQRGHRVTVICARSRYMAGRLDTPAREERNGVRVLRVRATGFGRGSYAGRLLDYLTFYVGAFTTLLWMTPRPRLVVSLTTPPLLPLLPWVLSRTRGAPYGIWTMDLHPEAEEAAGLLRPGSRMSRVLRGLAKRFYRGADFIVVLGVFMKDRLMKYGVAPDRVHTLSMWSWSNEVYPVDRSKNPLVEETGFGSRFVVMYSGNAGIAHTFDPLYDAMLRIDESSNVHFLFVGGGPRRDEVVSFAERHGLTNVTYRDYFRRDQLALSLSLGDLHLLTLRDEMAGIAVPSKLFGIMAAGRPVLVIGPRASEPAMVVEETGCGWVVDPSHDPDPVDRIVELIHRVANDPRELTIRGQRGLDAFRSRFSAERVLPSWADLIESHLQSREPPIAASPPNPKAS